MRLEHEPMAYLKIDKKQSGNYLRITTSQRKGKKVLKRDLFTLGKVENFNEIIEICKALGVKIYYDGPVQFEKSRSVYISDPNGYDIELSEILGGGL